MPDQLPVYRYLPDVLDALARHGLHPQPHTPPRALRDAINDLYRYEIRILRDRCRAGDFPTRELSPRVSDLRKRYLLLSIPVERWTQ